MARHAPFWGVPLLVLGAEFAYMFWLRKKKKPASIFLFIAFVGFLVTSFYVWAGGPEKTVKVIKKFQREMRDK